MTSWKHVNELKDVTDVLVLIIIFYIIYTLPNTTLQTPHALNN